MTAPEGATSYSYDPAGNRLSRTRGGSTTSYAYDRADRITTAGSVSYTVNANGNLVARGSDTFAYDQANRLISATVSGATSTYAYDGDGKRVSSTVGGTTTRAVYDVNAGLPVLLDDGSRKYVWGLGLAYAVPSSGGVEVYHTDGLGSVRAITDAAGTVTQTYQTDEFGIPTQTSGSSSQPFGYTGEQRDGETGFVYLRARLYDPASGRFVQRDPYPGLIGSPLSLHRYTYVGNNPINAIDPSGLAFSSVLKDPFGDDDPTKCLDLMSNRICIGWQPQWTPWGAVLIPSILKELHRGRENSESVRGSNVYEAFGKARNLAQKYSRLGDNAVDFVQELGPYKGRITGRMSSDARQGWRIDFDGNNPNKGFHINWWDRTGGRKREDWYQGYIRIEGGTQQDFWEILSHFP